MKVLQPLKFTFVDTRYCMFAVTIVLAFGLVMEMFIVAGVKMENHTMERGVAPMQELLQIQRKISQALHIVENHDQQLLTQCNVQLQDGICELPLLLQNTIASAQRLLAGEGGLAGLPLSSALTGHARMATLEIRDQARQLLHISLTRQVFKTEELLDLQRGLLEISTDVQRLESLVLSQLKDDFRSRRWLDLMAIIATGVLMTATLIALFWMWRNWRTSFSQLHANKSRLRAYADAVPDPAYVLDSNGIMVDFIGIPTLQNAHPLGISVGERIQDNCPAHLVSLYMDAIQTAIDTQAVQTLESSIEDIKGEKRWFESRIAPVEALPPNGKDSTDEAQTQTPQVIWVAREITNRVRDEQALRQLNDQLELRVAERTNELDEAMNELRSFNYTVSHDLRAPLRAVEAFISIAVEEAGDSLNVSTHAMLDRARKSAHQLAHMVESLLNLSRIGEMQLQNSTLDLTTMASDICQAFQVEQGAHRLQCHVEPGMMAWADEHLMRSLLQNLINNAVKYSAHREPAIIVIGSETQPDSSMAIYVRDNGAGFDMARASQLFQPFTRLHSARDFAGDGIGLATVRRIVTRHGGRVWAHGQVDAGATIYFTLPTQPSLERDRDFNSSRPASDLLESET